MPAKRTTDLTARADALKAGDVIRVRFSPEETLEGPVAGVSDAGSGTVLIEYTAPDGIACRYYTSAATMVECVRFAERGPILNGVPVRPATDDEFKGL